MFCITSRNSWPDYTSSYFVLNRLDLFGVKIWIVGFDCWAGCCFGCCCFVYRRRRYSPNEMNPCDVICAAEVALPQTGVDNIIPSATDMIVALKFKSQKERTIALNNCLPTHGVKRRILKQSFFYVTHCRKICFQVVFRRGTGSA